MRSSHSTLGPVDTLWQATQYSAHTHTHLQSVGTLLDTRVSYTAQLRMVLDVVYQANEFRERTYDSADYSVLFYVFFSSHFLMLTDDEHKLGWKVCPESYQFAARVNDKKCCSTKNIIVIFARSVIHLWYARLRWSGVKCVMHYYRIYIERVNTYNYNWIFIRVKVTSFLHKSIDIAHVPKRKRQTKEGGKKRSEKFSFGKLNVNILRLIWIRTIQ